MLILSVPPRLTIKIEQQRGGYIFHIINLLTMDIDLTTIIIVIVVLSFFAIPIIYDQWSNKDKPEE